MSYTILSGSIDEFSDSKQFIDSLPRLAASVPLNEFLSHDREVFITRAPGRLDVMGGIADYSGSLVLQLPIAAAAHVAAQTNNSNTLRMASVSPSEVRVFEMGLNEFGVNREPIDYATARNRFSATQDHWAAYVGGAILVLMRERDAVFSEGIDLLVNSTVPEGKGVSSSAALEVAAMNAIVAAFDMKVTPVEVALLCQKVENLVAGAACGVMDQMTSECGEANRLLELLCQPCEFLGTLAIPNELEFWGLDSGIKHTVGGSAYTTVRTAAFMGYRIIAALAGLPVTTDDTGRLHISDQRWSGYLANITPEVFEREFAQNVPESVYGQEFLAKYDATTDSVTTVDPETTYPVRVATQHPIYENARVQKFAEILRDGVGGTELGDLMFASHQSYSLCGLGSNETDLIANLVRDSRELGLFGARITGGGCGGTVAVLGGRGLLSSIEKVAREYEKRTGNMATIISGSSPGANNFQHLKLRVR